MSNLTFPDFTLEASPSLTDYLVGYRTNVTGGERRTALTDILNLFKQNTTTGSFVLTGNGSGGFTNTDLTYSSPTLTVPDLFNINGAGAISLTAGGSNKNVTLTPSGTGTTVYGVATELNGASAAGMFPLIVGRSAGSANIAAVAYASNASFRGFGVQGTPGSLSATTSGQTLMNMLGGGYDGTNWISGTGFIQFQAQEAFTTGARGTRIDFGTAAIGATTATTRMTLFNHGFLQLGKASVSTPAWGTGGVILGTQASITFTDNQSSGTVASAVGSSLAVPTFAASSATTFTNAANLYIAGDVAAGTNVTLTNSYGLWNVGKTRLDGNVLFAGAIIATPQALSGAGAINVTTTCTDFTSTGAAQALTLANGTLGQIKTISHVVDGGSGVLTPTTKIGFTTVTFTNVGDSVTLRYTASGWAIVGIFGAVAA